MKMKKITSEQNTKEIIITKATHKALEALMKKTKPSDAEELRRRIASTIENSETLKVNISAQLPRKYYKLGCELAQIESVSLADVWRECIIFYLNNRFTVPKQEIKDTRGVVFPSAEPNDWKRILNKLSASEQEKQQ